MTARRLEMLIDDPATHPSGQNPEDPRVEEDSHTESSEDEYPGEIPLEIQEHIEQREAFRKYLMSLPGAESVRFYKRYGAWTGRALFKDESTASSAALVFDRKKFPDVKIRQSGKQNEKLRFNNLPSDEGKET